MFSSDLGFSILAIYYIRKEWNKGVEADLGMRLTRIVEIKCRRAR